MSNKDLFKEAHRMAKEIKKEYQEVDYNFQFSLCLAYLQEEKEMVALRGTEKQVAWAGEIREYFLTYLKSMREKPARNGRMIAEDLKEDFPPVIRKDKVNKELRRKKGNEYLDKIEFLLKTEDRAVAFINLYKGVGMYKIEYSHSTIISYMAKIIKNNNVWK